MLITTYNNYKFKKLVVDFVWMRDFKKEMTTLGVTARAIGRTRVVKNQKVKEYLRACCDYLLVLPNR